MNKRIINNTKLGLFVLGGLLFLILLLYMIGRNRNLFGSTFTLSAQFSNVQGLVAGNNVRYAGIEAGTVKRINILNDTTIEVVMIVEEKMKPFIRKTAIASIGSDGLMGNKVINISPSAELSSFVDEGDLLPTREGVDTDKILRTLNSTNEDIAVIVSNLKITTARINNSSGLWQLLNDRSIPESISQSAKHVKIATSRAADFAMGLQLLIDDVNAGKGSLGAILKDTAISKQLSDALLKMNEVAQNADELLKNIHAGVTDIRNDLNKGDGTVNVLLKDSVMANRLATSLENIQKGTDGFNQNMEALKHSIFFRGYFRRLERKKNN